MIVVPHVNTDIRVCGKDAKAISVHRHFFFSYHDNTQDVSLCMSESCAMRNDAGCSLV